MPYLTDENLNRAVALWRRDFPDDVKKTLARADQEKAGCFSPTNSMAAGRWFFLGAPVDWSLNPTADPEFTWLVNRCWHLVDFGRAWRVTGNSEYVEAFVEQVRGWKTQNPVSFDLPWDEATYFQRVGPWRLLETGLRSESLLTAWQLMKDSPLVDADFTREFEELLADHAEYLCRFLGQADINHAMMHMLGPLLIGRHLKDHAQAKRWRHIAHERFELCLHRQVSPEGVHVELTPGYHNVSAELFARPWLVGRLHGEAPLAVFEDRLTRMARFTEASLRPDGRTVALGDWDHDPSSAQTLAFLGACFRDERLMSLGAAYQEILWKVGPDAWERCRALVGTGQPKTQSEAFSKAGYFVLRDAKSHLFFDAAALGGPHGHADALSFEWTWNRTLLFPDPGRFTYEEGDWRRWFKGTAAHAAVQVDGQDQTPYVSTQAWGEPAARVTVRTWQTDSRSDYLVAEHDGYHRLDDPVSCQRRVAFLKGDDLLIVADVLGCAGEHGFALRYPLNRPEGLNIHFDRARPFADVTMASAGVRMRLSFLWAGAVAGAVRLASEEGWVAERYGVKAPSPRLCLSGRFHGPAVLLTVVRVGSWTPNISGDAPTDLVWDSEANALRFRWGVRTMVLGATSFQEVPS